MEKTKRTRKANFSDSEVRVLLEEMQLEYVTIVSSLGTTINRDTKNQSWQRLTETVNACGVAKEVLRR